MKVTAFARTKQGSGASRRLRTAGQTPGIVYGGTEAPIAIALDHNALYHALKKEVFHSSILSLDMDGKTQQVVLRDFQMHAHKQIVLHIDFQRVSAKEKITLKVPVRLLNADDSPAVRLNNGIITQILNDVEVSCLPKDLPEFLELDLSDMEIDTTVHLSALPLPEGVSLTVQEDQDDQALAVSSVPRDYVEPVSDEESPDEAAGDEESPGEAAGEEDSEA